MKKLAALVSCLVSLNMISVGCAHKENISEEHTVQGANATSTVIQERDIQDANETLTAVGGEEGGAFWSRDSGCIETTDFTVERGKRVEWNDL